MEIAKHLAKKGCVAEGDEDPIITIITASATDEAVG